MKLSLEALFTRSFKPTGRAWLVKVKDVKGLDLYFNTRKEAREYKRLLQGSTRQLEAEIHLHEFDGGYMTEAKRT